MASVKLILKEKKIRNDGAAPLYIRVIKDRKTRFISLKIWLDPKHWDERNRRVKKSHPNSVRMNHMIASKKAEMENLSFDLEMGEKSIETVGIRRAILGSAGQCFLEYYEEQIVHYRKAGL